MDNLSSTTANYDGLMSAEKLTPLQLNAIKLDVRHTVLTPDYLEGLSKK